MYRLKKRMEVSASHCLSLPYSSKCNELHGHNYIITVECESCLLENGMIVDFSHIKETVNCLDHADLNQVIEHPTAENIAKWIYDKIPKCIKVTVQESEGNEVSYEEV